MSENTISQESYNLSTNDRFVLDIPLDIIMDTVPATQMNIYGFEIPEIVVGETKTKYMGYEVPIPSGVREDDKTLVIEFNLSSNLSQYAVLYAWLVKMTNNIEDDSTNDISTMYGLNVNLSILDEGLKEVNLFVFKDCWIHRLGKLVLDQSAQDGNIIKCSATLKYREFTFDYDNVLV